MLGSSNEYVEITTGSPDTAASVDPTRNLVHSHRIRFGASGNSPYETSGMNSLRHTLITTPISTTEGDRLQDFSREQNRSDILRKRQGTLQHGEWLGE